MAQVVNRMLESMLPHLEELQLSGIFTEEELRIIITRRRHFEYRLFRKPPNKQDYLKAIQYELNLDQLRKQRKEKMGVVFTNSDCEFGIVNRLHALYKRSLKHFKGDIKLWLQYIKFCQNMNQPNILSKVFGRVLSIHPKQVGLWIMASKFEFETQKDVSGARSILQQGIRSNPNSPKLWLEYFRMELLYVDKLIKRREMLGLDIEEEEPSGEVMKYKLPIIVFEHAVKSQPNDVEFRLKFLDISILFEKTENLELYIYKSVEKDFSDTGYYWDALANKIWRRATQLSISDIKQLETQSEDVYRQGMDKLQLNSFQLSILWSKYLDWHLLRLEQWEKCNNIEFQNSLDRLKAICIEVCDAGFLSEHHFLLIINKIIKCGLIDDALSLLTIISKHFLKSLSIWKLRLQLEEPLSSTETLQTMCRNAILNIDPKFSKEIWLHWINTLILRSEYILVEQVFKECIEAGHESCRDTLILQYLEWTYMKNGIKKLRQVYKSLQIFKPLSCSIYMNYIGFEKIQNNPVMPKIWLAFNEALSIYGHCNIDLWLDYITIKIHSECLSDVGSIYWRAIRSLDSHLVAEFTQRYALLDTINTD